MIKKLLYILIFALPLTINAQNIDKIALADSLFDLGDYNESLKISLEYIGECQQTKNYSGLVESKNLAANNLVRLGNLEDANQHSKESFEINTSKLNGKFDAECYVSQGYINLIQGKNDAAIQNFEAALASEKEDKNPKLESEIYNDFALVYWNTGNAELALSYHEKALKIRSTLFGDKHESVAGSLNNIGLLYSTNFPDKALDYYTKALEIYQYVYGDNHPKIAVAFNNMALIYKQEGDVNKSLEMFDKVLAIWQSNYGEDHPNVAFTYSNIAQLYITEETSEIALNYLSKAKDIYIKKYGNKHPEVANTYNFIGNVYNKNRQYDLALENYQQALIANVPKFDNTDILSNPELTYSYNSYTLLTSLLYKAQIFESIHIEKSLKFKDLTNALNQLELCDQLIEKIRHTTINDADKIALGQISSQVYEDALRVCSQLSETSLKWKEYQKKAFYFSEKNKSAVLLEALSESNAKQFANIPTELIEEETELTTSMAFFEKMLAQGVDSKTKEESYQSQLSKLKIRYATFTNKLKEEYPDYYDLKYNSSVNSVEEIQKELDDESILISYFQATRSGRLYIFKISNKDFKLYDIKRVKELDNNITGFRNSMKYRVFKRFAEESNQVYNQVMPFTIGKNVTKMVLVPDGRLSSVPFEALTTRKRKKDETDYSQLSYLIKKYAISYDYSATLFVQSKRKSDNRKDDNSIMLCAPIEFEKQNNLPGTASEVDEINKIFLGKGYKSDSYLHDKAQESFIKSNELKNYKFLHFATHGVVNESKPELSEIFLSKDATKKEDGDLFAGEIYSLSINADLVCLSACQTGLGKVSKGEGIIGLTRALLYAGSNNLIVSLWKVSDESTSKLMVDFYNFMLSKDQNTLDYSRSLQKAKLELINSEEFSNPFYWAPFILIGK